MFTFIRKFIPDQWNIQIYYPKIVRPFTRMSLNIFKMETKALLLLRFYSVCFVLCVYKYYWNIQIKCRKTNKYTRNYCRNSINYKINSMKMLFKFCTIDVLMLFDMLQNSNIQNAETENSTKILFEIYCINIILGSMVFM